MKKTWDGKTWRPCYFEPLSDEGKGGADFSLVEIRHFKPYCVEHGAMNKVSEIFWRCITLSGPKKNPCRAACQDAKPGGGVR